MPFRPTLRQLEYIVAVAECGHFGKAAKLCHVSQPTLSVQIGLVEDSLGIKIFERTTSTVLVTPIGETFIHGARLTLAAMTDLMDVVARDTKSLGGLVRIGTPPSFGPYFLPSFLPPIHRTYPDLKIYIVEDRPAAIEVAVIEGRLDCGIGPSCEDPGLAFVKIGTEQLYLGVPSDHKLASWEIVALTDLDGERLLALGSGNRLFENVRDLAQSSGGLVVNDYEGTSLDAIRQMVSVGMGCSIFPELYARAELQGAEDIKLVEIEGWKHTRPIGLYFRQSSGRREHFQVLAEQAKRSAASLGIGL